MKHSYYRSDALLVVKILIKHDKKVLQYRIFTN